MAETKVNYVVEVSKVGAGGQQAAAELQTVADVARQTNVSLQQSAVAGASANLSVQKLGQGTKTLTAGFKAMQGTLTLIGFQTFPALTLAATTAQSAFSGLKAASAATGASFAATAGSAAVIAASLYSVARAYEEFQKMQAGSKADVASQGGLEGTVELQASKLRDTLIKALEEGKIALTEFERDYIDRLLLKPTYERLRIIQNLVRDRMPTGEFLSDADRARLAGQRTADFNRRRAYELAGQMQSKPGEFDLQRFDAGSRKRELEAEARAQREYNELVEFYNQLRRDGLITEEQVAALSMEAETARLQRLHEINREVQSTKIHFASLREIERDAMTDFAGGLANTLVDVRAWVKDAGAAFANFFAQLAQSIAQAIMQMLILRALENAFPSFFKKSAEGGLYPRMMALGGVQTVSSATYFPRFNVVAGEAGSEMMAVLSRPRMMNLGGIEAAVGNAQGHRLALTSADALARGGAGGNVNITVSLEPGLRASIVQDSVSGAVVRVTQDAGRSTPLREAIRKVQ